MAFDLRSFGPGFFLNEGEPYDAGGPSRHPTSVWQGILSMSGSEWRAMAVDCFPGVDPDHLTPESVFELIEKTNTCKDLRSPVEVYIDDEGYHTVLVFDRLKRAY